MKTEVIAGTITESLFRIVITKHLDKKVENKDIFKDYVKTRKHYLDMCWSKFKHLVEVEGMNILEALEIILDSIGTAEEVEMERKTAKKSEKK